MDTLVSLTEGPWKKKKYAFLAATAFYTQKGIEKEGKRHVACCGAREPKARHEEMGGGFVLILEGRYNVFDNPLHSV